MNEIRKIDERIAALKAKRAALVVAEEKRAEQRVIAAARRAGLMALPVEKIEAIFASLMTNQKDTKHETGTTGNSPAAL